LGAPIAAKEYEGKAMFRIKNRRSWSGMKKILIVDDGEFRPLTKTATQK
jgi:hypothetical protein